jgi:hypothetical protein
MAGSCLVLVVLLEFGRMPPPVNAAQLRPVLFVQSCYDHEVLKNLLLSLFSYKKKEREKQSERSRLM